MTYRLLLAAVLAAFSLASHARADEDLAGPTQDLTPVSLRFNKALAGEFGGAQILRVSLMVKNVGTLPVRGTRGGVQVGTIRNASAPLYGPNGHGGFNLGAAIRPGETGMFLLEGQLGTLRHCGQYRAAIDTAHSLQSGTTLVFYNDSKVLTARESGAMKACVGGVIAP